MRTIQTVFLGVTFAFAAAGERALADDTLHIAGNAVGKDGVLTRRIAEVVGDTTPTTTPILTVDGPQVPGLVYQITGTVEYSNVQGDGYLEMWSTFPEGEQFFTRTLDATGAMGKLSGSSGPRPFTLPIQLVAGGPAPVRLDLNVVLPGPGHVQLSNLRLSGATGVVVGPRAWWSLAGALGGTAIGVVGAMLGVVCALGRYRRLAEALLIALSVLGVGGLLAGAAALSLGQAREAWFPLVLVGLLATLLPIVLRREVRRRFAGATFSGVRV